MEAARRALGELSRGLLESDLTARQQAETMKDARQALARYIEAVTAGMAPESAFNAVLAVQTQQMGANAVATQAASTAGAGGIPVWLGVTAAIAASVAVLWPFVLLVGSAAVALTSFAIAGAGFIAIGTLVAGAFGAIGAAVMLLGGGVSGAAGAADALTKAQEKLSNAQQDLIEFDAAYKGHLTILQQQRREQLVENIANDQQKYNDALTASQSPMAVLVGQLSSMKDALSQQAEPLARMITVWAAGAIPTIQQFGSEIMTWFGIRLPGVLGGISRILRDLAPDFISFGQYFGGVMDKIGPLLAPIAEGFTRLALQGARGLLDNLVRLADWFVKELPSLGPIVASVFGKIGDFIQWVASNWTGLNDFVTKQWPTTVKNAQDALKQLSDWWHQNGDTVKTFGQNLIDLAGFLNNTISLMKKFFDLLNGVGLGPTRALDAINALASALQWAADEAERLNNALSSSSGIGSSGRNRQRGFAPGRNS